MHKRILSASVMVQKETHFTEFRFHPGINILWGADAEDIVLTLAGILGGMPPLNGKAEIQWNADASLFVDIIDEACGVEKASTQGRSTAQLVKDFHKHRFLSYRENEHILDGTQLPAGTSGAGDLLLEKLRTTLAKPDDRPLFVINFLERLDEAVDIGEILQALATTGRQIFIAVPHYYEINTLEELPMSRQSTPFDLRATREYRELGFQIVNCPVCGKETLDSHWICRHCGWEYDGTTEENEYSSCNKATVADYQKNNL